MQPISRLSGVESVLVQIATWHYDSCVSVESEEVLLEGLFSSSSSSRAGRLVPRPSRVGGMINVGWLVWSLLSWVQFRGMWWSWSCRFQTGCRKELVHLLFVSPSHCFPFCLCVRSAGIPVLRALQHLRPGHGLQNPAYGRRPGPDVCGVQGPCPFHGHQQCHGWNAQGRLSFMSQFASMPDYNCPDHCCCFFPMQAMIVSKWSLFFRCHPR